MCDSSIALQCFLLDSELADCSETEIVLKRKNRNDIKSIGGPSTSRKSCVGFVRRSSRGAATRGAAGGAAEREQRRISRKSSRRSSKGAAEEQEEEQQQLFGSQNWDHFWFQFCDPTRRCALFLEKQFAFETSEVEIVQIKHPHPNTFSNVRENLFKRFRSPVFMFSLRVECNFSSAPR